MEDGELIRLARSGSETAFAELLAPLLPRARRLALGMVQDGWAADECVQEAALQSWLQLESMDPERPFRQWFLSQVVATCRQARRKEARRARWWALKASLVDWLWQVDAAGEDDWLQGVELRRAVAQLPHRTRSAIVLHFLLDLPLDEVAAIMGLRDNGVKSLIHRGLRRLRAVDLSYR